MNNDTVLNPNNLLSFNSSGASSSGTPSWQAAVSNDLTSAGNWLNSFGQDINPVNVAEKAGSAVGNALYSASQDPYIDAADNMFYSLPGINSLYTDISGNTSLGVGGFVPNTPSTPANSPQELAKTVGGAVGSDIIGLNTNIAATVNGAIKKIIPQFPTLNITTIYIILIGIVILIFVRG